MTLLTETNVRLIASAKSCIDNEAVRQLYAVAGLNGVQSAVGFPDLHPGRRTPIGMACVTEDVIYPHLIGPDIGCGMALFKADRPLSVSKRIDEWARLPFNLEHPWDESTGEFAAAQGLESTEFDHLLGTLGGGGHFAELQAVERVFDAGEFRQLGLTKKHPVVLIHSGSRGVGERALRDYEGEHQSDGVSANSGSGQNYLRGHDFAVRWAAVNRELIARRLLAQLGASAEPVCDGCHNSISREKGATSTGSRYIHRKGAVTAEQGAVVIPGSRGTLTYLVKPTGDGESHAWSLSHGAGRKWARSEARLRIRERFSAHELTHTTLGSRVICEQRDLLYEEAPDAYKEIDTVIEDLVDAGLAAVIATFRPLLTYKTRKAKR